NPARGAGRAAPPGAATVEAVGAALLPGAGGPGPGRGQRRAGHGRDARTGCAPAAGPRPRQRQETVTPLFGGSPVKKTALFLVAGGVLAVLVIGNLPGRQPAAEPAPEPQGDKGKDKGKEKPKENAADVAAIKKAGQSFLKAYLAGNAKAMAAHWTENG